MAKEYHTKCRTFIMEYLQSHKEQIFSASDVFQCLKANNQSVNLATVYRNLEKMTECGLLLKYKTADDESSVYQYVEPHANCHEHLHMQCRGCGRVIHLECGFMNEITEHLLQHHGFYLECRGSVLTGLCRECQKKETT